MSRPGWVPRPGALARGLVPLLATLLGGCIDFLDPQLPPPSAAVAQFFIHMSRGQVQLEGQVQPGMSLAHEWRTFPNDSLLVEGQPVAPLTVHANGARDYSVTLPLPTLVGPVTVQVPIVAGIPDRPGELRWYGVRRLDPDTLVLAVGADLHLHLDTSAPPQTPPPTGAQWFLQLAAGGHMFQLGADGLPPADMRVPPEFIPGDSTSVVNATLLLLHSGQANIAGGGYLLNVSFDQTLTWTVVRPRKGTTP